MYDVVIVSSYPSTYPGCGIGIYSANLYRELRRNKRMVSDAYVCSYGDVRPSRLKKPVELWFNQHDPKDVRRVTEQIRRRAGASGRPLLAILMLEYGLTENKGDGSDNGVYIAKHLKGRNMVTLGVAHTILRDPSDKYRDILVETAKECDGLLVHTDDSIDVLQSPVYGLTEDDCRIHQVDHGTRHVEITERDRLMIKREMGAEGKTIITSIGLRGPGKGTDEYIQAADLFMGSLTPSQRRNIAIVRAGPYGSKFIKAEGGKYKREHEQQMQDILAGTKYLKVHRPPGNDIFRINWNEGNYFDVEAMLDERAYMRLLGATNVAAYTYGNPQQDTSGTQADAGGAGRAIVSTDFAFAKWMIGCKHPKKSGVMNMGDSTARGLLTHCGKNIAKETAAGFDYYIISGEGQRMRLNHEENIHERMYKSTWSNSAWKMCQYGDFLHALKNTKRGRGRKFIRSSPKPEFAKENPN